MGRTRDSTVPASVRFGLVQRARAECRVSLAFPFLLVPSVATADDIERDRTAAERSAVNETRTG